MKVLVVSHRHGLLPFAWRLLREGHEVECIVMVERYQRCWDGRLPKAITGAVRREALEPWKEHAATGELAVLTDSTRAMEVFTGAPKLWGHWAPEAVPSPTSMALGAWFDGTEFSDLHWWLPDPGLWPGGLGPALAGAGTLVRPALFKGPAHELDDLPVELEGRRGLVTVPLYWNNDAGAFRRGPRTVGLPWLHTHAWLAGVENFGEVLHGAQPRTTPAAFTVALPVSQPPWPTVASVVPTGTNLAVPADLTKHCLFHDIQVTLEGLRTAGADGLVAVAHAQGETLEWARRQALAVATSFPLTERQLRPDAAGLVPAILAELERIQML